jgi:hypothetical protein
MTDRNRVVTNPFTPHGLDAAGNPEAAGSTDGCLKVLDCANHPGEDDTLDRTWGGPLAKKVSLTGDSQVGVAGPCVYYGYLVTTALSAAAVNVRDASSAGTGDIVDIIAASAAAGVQNRLATGIYCPTGVYADFGGTGTVTFFYQQ